MKKIIYSAMILSLAFATSCKDDKNDDVIGQVSFKTAQIWTIPAGNGAPKQEWSDVVMATGARKNTFNGTVADCCQNSPYGDLFSWHAVNAYKDQLCPGDWRVPTHQDFINLDMAMGGTGNGRTGHIPFVNEKYITLWGGTFGGDSRLNGTLESQGSWAFYWSATAAEDATDARSLQFGANGSILPKAQHTKSYGFMVRCVRD